MLNLGGYNYLSIHNSPNKLEEISPFLERFFADDTVIRIPYGLGPYIGKLRGPAKVNKQYSAIGGKSPLLDWTMKQGRAMLSGMKDIDFLPAFRYGFPL